MSPTTRKKWNVLPLAPATVFDTFNAYPKLVAQLLHNRGVRTPAEAEAFLRPQASTASLEGLPGAKAGVERIAKAIKNREKIAIFGDFDVDGLTSSAVLTQALRGLGGQVVAYIPDRAAEGHGLNLKGLQFLRDSGVTLVITADCGITNGPEIITAGDWSMDVIVTDHHTPPDELPQAVAVIDPKLPNADPNLTHLASCGVAYKLAEALYHTLGKPIDKSLLEFVALGTIADVAPMVGANRGLVVEGLARLNDSKNFGLQELMRLANIRPGDVDARAIGFALAPRLNAPGRVHHADASYLLLTARNEEEAKQYGAKLEEANLERQRQTKEIVEKALAMVGDSPTEPIIMVGDPSFHPSVIGLVANKLVDKFRRPAIVYQNLADETRGSCRSIPEFDVVAALREHDSLFVRYGGHSAAAGFTIPTSRLETLREGLLAGASGKVDKEKFAPEFLIDAQIRLERLNGDIIRSIHMLAPHGAGNQTPLFMTKGVDVREARQLGATGKHVRMSLNSGTISWNAIAFNVPEGTMPLSTKIDMVFTMEMDRFNGREKLQLVVADMRPAEQPNLL